MKYYMMDVEVVTLNEEFEDGKKFVKFNYNWYEQRSSYDLRYIDTQNPTHALLEELLKREKQKDESNSRKN